MKANLLCLGAAQSHKVISRNTPKKEAAAKEEGKKIEIRGNKTKKKGGRCFEKLSSCFSRRRESSGRQLVTQGRRILNEPLRRLATSAAKVSLCDCSPHKNSRYTNTFLYPEFT